MSQTKMNTDDLAQVRDEDRVRQNKKEKKKLTNKPFDFFDQIFTEIISELQSLMSEKEEPGGARGTLGLRTLDTGPLIVVCDIILLTV